MPGARVLSPRRSGGSGGRRNQASEWAKRGHPLALPAGVPRPGVPLCGLSRKCQPGERIRGHPCGDVCETTGWVGSPAHYRGAQGRIPSLGGWEDEAGSWGRVCWEPRGSTAGPCGKDPTSVRPGPAEDGAGVRQRRRLAWRALGGFAEGAARALLHAPGGGAGRGPAGPGVWTPRPRSCVCRKNRSVSA